MNENIPAYNVKAVIHETGLTPATLRAWERRYGLIKPTRSPGGHRLYTQADIALLKWLMARQAEGLSISHAVELWRNQEQAVMINAEVLPILHPSEPALVGSPTVEQLRSRWITSCMTFNETAAELTITQALALTQPEVVCTEVFQKGLAEIGRGWYNGQVSIQQEHFASALAVRRLNALLAAAPAAVKPARLLAACPPGEAHDLALLMLAFILRWRGWDVIYLGANVPLTRMDETLRSASPAMVISVAQTLPGAAALVELADFLKISEVPLAFGGGIFNEIPALTQRIAGHFLGQELTLVPKVVEHLLNNHPKVSDPLPISPAYQAVLESFQQKHTAIAMTVSQALQSRLINPRHIEEANQHFTRAIIAALTLGDIHFLDDSIGWLSGLLENYGLAQNQASQYYSAYSQAVADHMGNHADVILHWLSGVQRSSQTGKSYA